MVNISFSLPPEKFKQIYELNQAMAMNSDEKDIPFSHTVALLVQRGLAYTVLLEEKVNETAAPEKVAVKPKHRNKKW